MPTITTVSFDCSGTIDFTDPTACTDCPCPACCDITTGCCASDPVPQTVHVTIGNVSGLCNCGAGGTFTLTYNSGTAKWEGTGALGSCGRNVTLAAYCIKQGVNPFHWFIDVSFSDSCVAPITGQQASSEVCSPLSVQWAQIVAGGCCNGAGSKFSITLTA